MKKTILIPESELIILIENIVDQTMKHKSVSKKTVKNPIVKSKKTVVTKIKKPTMITKIDLTNAVKKYKPKQ